MGASGSKSGGSEEQQDLYAVLGVEVSASPDDIKKAFRRAALREHPDKHPEDTVTATKKFHAIQQAYEVLSDDQERAWYDNHRQELASGNSAEPDIDLRKSTEKAPNLSSHQILRFFNTRAWSQFDDSSDGFYTVYRLLFDLIAKDEQLATPYIGDPPFSTSTPELPSFGTSASSYDTASVDQPAIKTFYAVWANNFASRKAFASADRYRTTEAPDRRYKRAMEKENRRLREDARKEYNDTVRTLASFVKKRDPRFLNSPTADPLKTKALEAERIKNELRRAALDRAAEREKSANEYQVQDWQKASVSSDEEVAADERSEESEEEDLPDQWYCHACEKQFQSQGAWTNHERSKKHLKQVADLRRRLLAEGIDLDEPASEAEEGLTETVSEQQLSHDDENPVVMEDTRSEDDGVARVDPIVIQQSSATKKRNGRQGSPAQQIHNLATSQIEELSIIDERTKHEATDSTDTGQADVENIQISKKDKRRAKEAAKKVANDGQKAAIKCNVCSSGFASRTRLFDHIKESGHAAAAPSSNKQRSKKG